MTQYRPAIGVSEAVTLLFIFLASKAFLTKVMFIYHDGLNASWVIPVIQTGIGLGGLLLLVAVLNKYPGRDLVEIGEELAGPYVNLLFALYYLVVFVFGAGMTLREISEQVVSGFLPDTPISLVVLAFVSGTAVVSYLGIEAVARTARFLLGVMVVTAMALVLLTIPLWQFDAFYPLWGGGLWKLLAGALKNTGVFVQILLLGIICPFLPVKQVKQIGVRGVVVAGFFLFLYVLAPLLIFDYPSVTELSLPSFEMARIINIGRFGQRMEVVFLPVWVFGNMIYLSISLYAGAAVLARLCRLRDYRPFVLSVAVLTTTVAFVPQNMLQAAYWNHRLLNRYSFVILVAILVMLLLVARLKNKGGARNEQGG